METNLTPTMTNFFVFPRFYRPSDHDEAVRERGQFGSVRMVRCLRCRSQSIVVHHFYSQLVLPPYTVKIRGGRSIFLRHSQARVLPSHAVKTGRGRSTRYQAHVLPPYAVKTRGGRSVFRQAYVTQLRQGEDARHFIVSLKRMSYHPTQLR